MPNDVPITSSMYFRRKLSARGSSYSLTNLRLLPIFGRRCFLFHFDISIYFFRSFRYGSKIVDVLSHLLITRYPRLEGFFQVPMSIHQIAMLRSFKIFFNARSSSITASLPSGSLISKNASDGQWNN